jgi:hypothetical protein
MATPLTTITPASLITPEGDPENITRDTSKQNHSNTLQLIISKVFLPSKFDHHGAINYE